MILAQNFVKLFHCSDVSGAHRSSDQLPTTSQLMPYLLQVDLISLDKAASALLGDMHDPMAMKSNSYSCYVAIFDLW